MRMVRAAPGRSQAGKGRRLAWLAHPVGIVTEGAHGFVNRLATFQPAAGCGLILLDIGQ